jgi:lysophospholipase L1-like esterase
MNNLALAVVGLLAQGLVPPELLDRVTGEPIGSDPAIAPQPSPNPRLVKSAKPIQPALQPEFSRRQPFSLTPFSLTPFVSPAPDLPPLPSDDLTMAWSALPQTIVAPRSIPLTTPRPASGSQLYQQRQAALQTGHTYTRLPANSFWQNWQTATQLPTHQQWMELLAQEAQAMARGQGSNRLTVMVGDSLSLWFPVEHLAGDRFWLNQGISGDTTAGVLQRLSAFERTRPDTIHVMIGINDLRRGASDAEILGNLQQIMRRLKHAHPQATIYVHSILPTRLEAIPLDRVAPLNQQIAIAAQQEQVQYLDLMAFFLDDQGALHSSLTTDGLHLSLNGYAVWDWAMRSLLTT